MPGKGFSHLGMGWGNGNVGAQNSEIELGRNDGMKLYGQMFLAKLMPRVNVKNCRMTLVIVMKMV